MRRVTFRAVLAQWSVAKEQLANNRNSVHKVSTIFELQSYCRHQRIIALAIERVGKLGGTYSCWISGLPCDRSEFVPRIGRRSTIQSSRRSACISGLPCQIAGVARLWGQRQAHKDKLNASANAGVVWSIANFDLLKRSSRSDTNRAFSRGRHVSFQRGKSTQHPRSASVHCQIRCTAS